MRHSCNTTTTQCYWGKMRMRGMNYYTETHTHTHTHTNIHRDASLISEKNAYNSHTHTHTNTSENVTEL